VEAYKVLRKDRDGLTSLTEHHPHTFEPGGVTVSVNAPIFVFSDRGAAFVWARTRAIYTVEIWRVETDYLWDVSRIIHTMDPALENPEAVEKWWRGEINLKTMPVPYKTKVTPALRLVSQVPLESAIVRLGQAEAGGP
jgi:hypothetical protein